MKHFTLSSLVGAFLLLSSHLCFSQECGTTMSPEHYERFMMMEDYITSMSSDQNLSFGASSYSFPVKLYLIADSDGNNAPNLDKIIDDIISTNNIFSGTGISFYVCDYVEIKSDKYSDLDLNDEQDDLLEAYYDNGAINVYIVEKLTKNDKSIGGVGSWPSMDDQRIILINSLTGNGTSLTHEFGHYFNLLHTHDEGQYGKDFVGSENEIFGVKFCELLGDLCCDTPADPGLKDVVEDADDNCNCTYVGTATDANGKSYSPDLYNLMSYNPHRECRTELTADQHTRIQNAAVIRDKQLTKCEAADLIVEDLKLSTNIILPGDEIEVEYTLENVGDIISGSGKVAFYISERRLSLTNNTILAEKNYRRISSGSQRSSNVSLRVPGSLKGAYYIHAEVDYDHRTPEYDEANNFTYKKIYIGQPDIVSKDETVEGKNGGIIQSGGEIEVNSKVYNDGYGFAGRSRMNYYLSTNDTYDKGDHYLGFSLVDELEPSPLNGIFNKPVSRTLRLPSDVTSFKKVGGSKGIYQDYYVLLVCDASDNIDETDESNNVAAVKVHISSATDLEITHLDLSADRIPRFTDLTIDYTVENTGTEAASRWTKIKFFLSDDRSYDENDIYLEEKRVKALDAEEQLSGNVTISKFDTRTWRYGDNYILAIIDPGGLVDEGNEDNNTSRHELEVYLPISTSSSDLEEEDILFKLFPVPANKTITVESSLDATAATSLKVIDLSGKVLIDQYLGHRAQGKYSDNLDITHLPAGIFLLQIDKDGISKTKRFVISR